MTRHRVCFSLSFSTFRKYQHPPIKHLRHGTAYPEFYAANIKLPCYTLVHDLGICNALHRPQLSVRVSEAKTSFAYHKLFTLRRKRVQRSLILSLCHTLRPKRYRGSLLSPVPAATEEGTESLLLSSVPILAEEGYREAPLSPVPTHAAAEEGHRKHSLSSVPTLPAEERVQQRAFAA